MRTSLGDLNALQRGQFYRLLAQAQSNRQAFKDALKSANQGLKFLRPQGDELMPYLLLLDIKAYACMRLGRYKEAETSNQQLYNLAGEHLVDSMLSFALANSGALASGTGDGYQAIRDILRASNIASDATTSFTNETLRNRVLGRVNRLISIVYRQFDPERAMHGALEALKFDRKVGDLHSAEQDLFNVVTLSLLLEDYDTARVHVNDMIVTAKNKRRHPTLFIGYVTRAMLRMAQQEMDKAALDFERAELLMAKVETPGLRQMFVIEKAKLLLHQHKAGEAKRLLATQGDAFSKRAPLNAQLDYQHLMSRVSAALNLFDEALVHEKAQFDLYKEIETQRKLLMADALRAEFEVEQLASQRHLVGLEQSLLAQQQDSFSELRQALQTSAPLLLCGLVGIAVCYLLYRIQRDRLYARNQLDDDTGVFTHGEILRRYDRELQYAARSEAPISIIWFQVRNYEQRLAAMDAAARQQFLREIGEACRDSCGRRGHAGRVGPSEFVLVLPNTDEHLLASKVRRLELRLDLVSGTACTDGQDSAVALVLNRAGQALEHALRQHTDNLIRPVF
jgi:GGDEF domain-containing protein